MTLDTVPSSLMLSNIFGLVFFFVLPAVVVILFILYVVGLRRQKRLERGIREMMGDRGAGSFRVGRRKEPADPHPRPYRTAHRPDKDT